ncbi:MAG: hypothetical protein DRI79_11610, partial [Chloroflexi bacterium]
FLIRTGANLCSHNFFPQTHSFVVRIWWEQGLTRPNGRPLWRGYIQHAASGQTLVFQSLDELLRFIQSHTGVENEQMTSVPQNPPRQT